MDLNRERKQDLPVVILLVSNTANARAEVRSGRFV